MQASTNDNFVLQIKNTQVSVCKQQKKEEIVQFDQFDEDLIPKSKIFSPINANLNLKCVDILGNNKIYDIFDTKTNDQQNKSDSLLDQISVKQRNDQSLHQVNVMTERLGSQNLIYYAPQYIPDLKQFLNQPVPVDKIIQCSFIKKKKGCWKQNQQFELYFSESLKFLCASLKQTIKNKQQSILSINSENFKQKQPSYLGIIEQGIQDLTFCLYNEGEHPKLVKNLEKTRKELALFSFRKSIQGLQSIEITIPSIINGKPREFQPISKHLGIQQLSKTLETDNFSYFSSRCPIYSEEKNAYQLKFSPRVRTASKKNFIIVSNNSQNDDDFIVQFGKCGKQYYNLDICHPLSILQAFALCVSQFLISKK